MAKVYDALRRAEEDRKRRTQDDGPAVAPLELELPGTPAPRPAAKRLPFYRRWFRRRGGKSPLDATTEVNKRRITLLQPDSYVSEQFRALRGRLDALASQSPLRTVVVTSPSPGDGKTTSAINLAIVTAMSVGRRVLLIDCDLRKPKVHGALGLNPEAGLAEVLTDAKSLDQAVMKVEGVNLEVLAVRGRPANPSELLGSAKMRELVEEVAHRYDRVILDTPAALGLPDAKAVSELCDGLVVVVRADLTPQQDVEATLELFDRRRILGFLLNGTEDRQGRYGYAT